MNQHVLRGFARPGEVLLHTHLPFSGASRPTQEHLVEHLTVELLVVELLQEEPHVGR